MYRRLPPGFRLLPQAVVRHILHFEASIEDAVRRFAAELPAGARVLDAGAGEGQYASAFARHSYVGLDLGIGDEGWSYAGLDVIGNLQALPFADGTFEACLNVVTLEHVPDPAGVLREISRVLRHGAPLLLVTPLEWEEHQQPHDYFRYTRYGLRMLLTQAGMVPVSIAPVGGYFRLLGRRLQNGVQFFPPPLSWVVMAVLAIPSLVLPFFDRFDEKQNFTLGHICVAIKGI